jgi:hypothetical protein
MVGKRRPTGGMGLRSAALIIILLYLLPTFISAETQTSVVLDLTYTALINPDPDNLDLALLPVGLGEIKINSTGNRNVRAYLEISADLGVSYLLTIDRAYLRTRFENMRLTLGKTRLSWGEGLVFNAADVLLGSSDLNVNLSAEEYRNQSEWLSALYFPLGRFAFLEAVAMPEMIDPETYNPADPTTLPELSDSGAGLRLGFELDRLFDTAVETGYFYSGNRDDHSAYLSLQGGAGINWHASASLALPTATILEIPGGSDILDGLLISGGFYGLPNIGQRLSLSLRAEALYKPGAEFTAQGAPADYGIYGYGEVSLGIDQLVNAYVRSIISPVDLSALVYGGASFSLYQGFTVYGDLSAQIGETTDVFPNRELGGYTLRLGIRFIY